MIQAHATTIELLLGSPRISGLKLELCICVVQYVAAHIDTFMLYHLIIYISNFWKLRVSQ